MISSPGLIAGGRRDAGPKELKQRRMNLAGSRVRKSCLKTEQESEGVFRIPSLMGESTQKYKENFA